ncbi:glycosyltransferase [Sabulibacter ruber]|uniref:glycosyltransferase n=1 Tax=Sabulibacter ruber TaxID=2811901 RepID=UPI001A95AAA4|nr:glycosyltransferase family 2 protein [Sabulibacter ruber]
MILTGYSVLITALWILVCLYVLINSRKVKYLKDIPVTPDSTQPSVAVVIAVKDEEAEVKEALTSVCLLEYQPLKILVIDDRSTDRTPEILRQMVQQNPELTLFTIRELPGGWLGKNHALYQGYCATTEEWLLFTDADVKFGRQALKKAMAYAVANRLDHLTVLPEITSRSVIFQSVMTTFSLMLELRQRPWDVPKPNTKASIGVGAFNLIRRTAYEKAGTHTVISLRPDDDLKLGELVKKAGLRQDVMYGEKEVSLEWYTSLKEFVNGLMKNTFSVANYNLLHAIGMALATFLVFVLPVPLVLFSGAYGWQMAVLLLISQMLLMAFKSGIHGKWWHTFMIPFAGAVMIFVILRAAYVTLRQGGIYWRNSFYPLSELRKQK